MEKERMRRAANGIEIYDYKNPASHSFFISLFLRSGSMYESEEENGITHFLEHVVIRNVNALMDGGLYPLLDRYGIEFNASTYSEMVQFYVSGAARNFDVGARIISLVLSPIALSPAEIRTECERIKAEIRENDERGSLTNFTNGIVYSGTSLSRPITGTVGGVSRITRSRLENFRKHIFTPENIFLYVTGAYGERELAGLSQLIGKSPVFSGYVHDNVAPIPPAFGRREGRVAVKNADFTMLRFTFDMDMSDISVPESDLLYDLLLGGYNSRFFIEMSERRGLCYDVTGSTERYRNIGTFAFSFEVKAGSVYEAVEICLSILTDLKRSTLDETECMKAGYVDNAYMLYDDTRELNFTFAYDNHILSASHGSIEERIAAYKAVTPQRLREVASTVFRPENLTLTVKGKKKQIDTSRLEELISHF